MTRTLYDTDFFRWTQEQAEALRTKNFAVLDLDHLAAEIEDLGKAVRHAIESHLERLLLHLLKWRYAPAQESRRGWLLTIRRVRRELARFLDENPGLQQHPERYFTTAYRHIREDAAIETDLPLTTFPEVCPWPMAQVLGADFLPEANASMGPAAALGCGTADLRRGHVRRGTGTVAARSPARPRASARPDVVWTCQLSNGSPERRDGRRREPPPASGLLSPSAAAALLWEIMHTRCSHV